ncbi:UNVERIFIED_CONTAM: hypothetical protein K2H54_013297 [Gekko kuhli]
MEAGRGGRVLRDLRAQARRALRLSPSCALQCPLTVPAGCSNFCHCSWTSQNIGSAPPPLLAFPDHPEQRQILLFMTPLRPLSPLHILVLKYFSPTWRQVPRHPAKKWVFLLSHQET